MSLKTKRRFYFWPAVVLLLAAFTLAGQTPQAQRSEASEVQKAMEIKDPAARLKELERLVAAHPESPYMGMIETAVSGAKIELSPVLDEVLALQKEIAAKYPGIQKAIYYPEAAKQILEHRYLSRFDKAQVTRVIRSYRDEIEALLKNPEAMHSVPESLRAPFVSSGEEMNLFLAKASLNEGRAQECLESLDSYQKNGGEKDAQYYYLLSQAQDLLGRSQEAYGGYLSAAVENYKDAAQKAKELYQKNHGTTDGFAAEFKAKLNEFEAKRRELPFPVEPFKPVSDWTGKTVLAEIFTGSECPPCVAADLGFDGLLEAVDGKYLAVLEYHLPIPGPDPMMNAATKKRQDFYRVGATPSTFFDGENKSSGGGYRDAAEKKFKEYLKEVSAGLAEKPAVALTVRAARASGDLIRVDYGLDKILPKTDHFIALVQNEVKHGGGNGILFHKMVVRQIVEVDPGAASNPVILNPAECEKAAAQYLESYEKEHGFTFKEKRAAIDRTKLSVVFFVQDKETKKVYNAAVATVK